jgi:phosphoribosylglycinamide formyltransferase-1
LTPALDAGPIVAQAAVPVLPHDDEATLAARVLAQEHRLYPQVVRWFVEDRVRFASATRVVVEGAGVATDAMHSPREGR